MSVRVTNTGTAAGSDVVQLYASFPASCELTHAPLMLRAFAKIHNLAPGKSEVARMHLDKYAFSYWEEGIGRWVVEPGDYTVRVGRSSAPEDLSLSAVVRLEKGFEWNGL